MTRSLGMGLVFVLVLATSSGEAEAQSAWDAARAHGYNLPKRFGVGVTYYTQEQGYNIDSLDLGLFSWDPSMAQGLGVDNETTSIHAVFDYWLLPFLNVEVLVGNVDGKTRVGVSALDIGLPMDDITVDYDGLMYGGGFTLAGGWDQYFVAITTQYTTTDLDIADSTVEAWVVTPKLGIQMGRTAMWVGAMYQNAEEQHVGTYTVTGVGDVPFDVTLRESKPWNYLAGLSFGMGDHLEMVIEGGFGDRDALLARLAYRF